MTELYIDVSRLPTIPEKNSWETFMTNVDHQYDNWKIECRAYWRDYRNWIIFILVILAIGIILTVTLVLSPSAPSYPCLSYQSNTPASSVSIACLQYVWNTNCKNPYTFLSGYTGWWNRSPQGTTMVPCNGRSQCGVGSYENILIYMSFCQIGINQ